MQAHHASTLQAIPITVEQSSGNIEPLLHEIRHALAGLLEGGPPTCIDLKRIPLAPGEEARLIELLGTGEVTAAISASGPSEAVETSFPGVWLVTHLDERSAVQARFIEVAFVPEILRSQPADMAEGLSRLAQRLHER